MMECFTTINNDLEGRLDPHFYNPIFLENVKRLKKYDCQRLEQLVRFSNETWNQLDYFESEFPYIEIGEIDIITGEIKNISSIKKENAPSRARMIVRNKDIIVSTTRPNRGAISFIDGSKDGYIASTGFAILRELKRNGLIKEYLFYALRLNTSLMQMLQRSSGGNYPAIVQAELEKILLPVPSKDIQEKIIQIMHDAYSKKKRNEEEAENIFTELENEIFKIIGLEFNDVGYERIFTLNYDELEGRLDPKFYNFEIRELKNLIINKYGFHKLDEVIDDTYRYPTFYGIEYIDTGIPVIKGENINNHGLIEPDQNFDFISEETHAKYARTQLKENDLIFTVRGLIGKVGVFEKIKEQGNINANVIKITLKDSANPKFYWWYLNSTIGQKFINTLTSGQVQKTITVPDIKNIIIPVLPEKVQNDISEMIKNCIKKHYIAKNEAISVVEHAKKEVEKILFE